MDKNVKLTQFRLGETQTKKLVINGVEVTVKETIPYEDVLAAIQWCIDYVIYDKPFISAPLKTIVVRMALLQFWTDIDMSFLETVKQVSEFYEAYDIISKNNIYNEVYNAIDTEQKEFFFANVEETLKSIVDYRNSAQGIVDVLSADAEINANSMQDSLDFLNNDNNAKLIANFINAAKETS